MADRRAALEGREPVEGELRTTPLTALHEQAGASLGPFAGWRMPISFEGTVAEHRAVRADVGIFDVSHLGTLLVDGTAAVDVVAATFTNDPATLGRGESQYTLCCDERGGIVDDCIVYHLPDGRYLAVPNAANTEEVAGRLDAAAATCAATVLDASTRYAILAVQGPRSLAVVGGVTGGEVDALPHLRVVEQDLGGATGWVCRTGYTGERGCELVLVAEAAPGLWSALVDAGATPCGLGARDTLRLEMGYPLHGNDIDRSTTPYEAGLGWAVRLDRGPFTGREALRDARRAGPGRRLWGLRGRSRRPPRPGMDVLHGGEVVGTVTSGSFSPTLERGIGLGYLASPLGPGEAVTVDVRGREEAFAVVRPPFVDRDPGG